MGIRIQPREIEVPEDDPFKNDLLGRREPAEILTHIVGSIDGPCVLAIDAAWGTGKTTFLKIWSQYLRNLRNEGFPVVEFNAWETDFAGDPFVALSTELTNAFQKYPENLPADKITAAKKAAKEVLRRAVPGVIRLATAGILDVGQLAEKEIGQALASYAEYQLSRYQDERESVEKFRTVLQEMAATLSKSRDGRPLVVVIDELDRCRPSYAIELLEVAKHLFTVDHIVFALAVNRAELAQSVRALYGTDFDAEGYLRRFFDVDFRLPEADRKAFIEATLNAIQIDDYFNRTQDSEGRQDANLVRRLLRGFFGTPALSLRQVAQALHRLGVVFASLRDDKRSFAITAVVALIIRVVDPALYHRFVRGDVSDQEVVDTVFSFPGTASFRHTDDGIIFEAYIVAYAYENTFAYRASSESFSSPLLSHYQAIAEDEQSDNGSPDPNREHAQAVISQFGYLRQNISRLGFKYSVKRLELLSTDLIDERA